MAKFLHWTFCREQERKRSPLQGGCLNLVTEASDCPLWCLLSARETKWGSFSFSLSSFFKPDNFLQLTWDLILTSRSFTCFDILEIEMSVRWTLSRVWSDITQALPKPWLVSPGCLLLKGDLKEGFRLQSLHLQGEGIWKSWVLARLCTYSLPFAFSASVSLSVKQSDRSLSK